MKAFQIERRDNGLLVFVIMRAPKRNAINYEVMDGLLEVLEMAKAPDIKGLILTGEGDQAFCAGGDLAAFHELKTEEQAYGMLSKMGAILFHLLTLNKPTIALLNGLALGGGCELAAACDLRIARKGMAAGFVQGRLAITTGWGGGTILLEKFPYSTAMRLLLEARPFSAEELHELGFIDLLYEENDKDALNQLVENIFSLQGDVLRAYKEMALRKWETARLQENIEQEIRRCSILWEQDAHHEQVAKFNERKG